MSLSTHFRNHLIHGGTATALPRLELMPYHADTIRRWRAEGLPDLVQSQNDLHTYFGLDPLEFFFLWPDVDAVGCREKITTATEFDAVRKQLYSLDAVARRMEEYSRLLALMREQNGILWVPLHGFFWHPRDLFGVARTAFQKGQIPAHREPTAPFRGFAGKLPPLSRRLRGVFPADGGWTMMFTAPARNALLDPDGTIPLDAGSRTRSSARLRQNLLSPSTRHSR